MEIPGFLAAAVQAGIRYPNRLDVGLIYSEVPAVAAGVFTTNLVKAAPVTLDMARIAQGKAQAILVNSGVANACTGQAGYDAAITSSAFVAQELGIPADLVLVASTGVIGEPFDPAKIGKVMPELVRNLVSEGFSAVSQAIMTTDTVPKLVSKTKCIDGRDIHLLGVAKGAGMIMPNMATMLCFVCTDAAIDPASLNGILRRAVDVSFNAITIDGDTSTNDTVLVLANGRAGNPEIGPERPAALVQFEELLIELLRELAMKIVADGEGATKRVAIEITGAVNGREAELAARTVANSNLVKTAFFGEDANWGRIIAALGRSGAQFEPNQVDIAFDQVMMVRNGLGLGRETEKAATQILKQKEFTLHINLKAGAAAFTVYTCDFSIDYVKINADYRS